MFLDGNILVLIQIYKGVTRLIEFFQNFNPVTQAFLATLFTWGMTALGASVVFADENNKPAIFR